jgi:hypothetical protein
VLVPFAALLQALAARTRPAEGCRGALPETARSEVVSMFTLLAKLAGPPRPAPRSSRTEQPSSSLLEGKGQGKDQGKDKGFGATGQGLGQGHLSVTENQQTWSPTCTSSTTSAAVLLEGKGQGKGLGKVKGKTVNPRTWSSSSTSSTSPAAVAVDTLFIHDPWAPNPLEGQAGQATVEICSTTLRTIGTVTSRPLRASVGTQAGRASVDTQAGREDVEEAADEGDSDDSSVVDKVESDEGQDGDEGHEGNEDKVPDFFVNSAATMESTAKKIVAVDLQLAALRAKFVP